MRGRLISSHFDRSARMEAYVAPARARAQPWRLFAAALILMIGISLSGVFIGLYGVLTGASQVEMAALTLMRAPEGIYLILAGFLFWILAMGIALRLLHRRGLGSLINPSGRIRWRAYGAGAAAALAMSLLTSFIEGASFVWPEPAGASVLTWAPLALLALPFIAVQTGAEELVFRGYLVQQLAARWRSAWIWCGAPALLFGLLHWNPAGYGAGAGLVLILTGLIGVALTVLTVRTGDLSAAMGVHFGLNAHALLLVAPGGYASGLALFRWPVGEGLAGLIGLDLALTAALVLAAAIWFSPSRRGG